MNPTKEETDQTLARIQAETDQVFFRDLGNHNRAIARERVHEYRRKSDHLPSPSLTQYRSVVRGGDRYDFHRNSIPWRLIALVSGLLLIGYAIVRSL